jgi:hypothetical protein
MTDKSVKHIAVEAELSLFAELNIHHRLEFILSSKAGLAKFAEGFYFVRYGFYRTNFIVGSRCPPHEQYWAGLTKNLLEELGGGITSPHNQLYRIFLREAANKEENELREPDFAKEFNHRWETYCQTVPVTEALVAIGVYEALDNPDYDLFFQLMKDIGLNESALEFFAVHAKAHHYEIFEDIVFKVSASEQSGETAKAAIAFVIETQKYMWKNLLSWLENQAL